MSRLASVFGEKTGFNHFPGNAFSSDLGFGLGDRCLLFFSHRLVVFRRFKECPQHGIKRDGTPVHQKPFRGVQLALRQLLYKDGGALL
jgi:hypothetical protein